MSHKGWMHTVCTDNNVDLSIKRKNIIENAFVWEVTIVLLAITDICFCFLGWSFNLWKVFIILRSRLSRLRTFCIRRHFTAVSSLLAGLMRWAVCLQTRISCFSSGGTSRERDTCLVHVKHRDYTAFTMVELSSRVQHVYSGGFGW